MARKDRGKRQQDKHVDNVERKPNFRELLEGTRPASPYDDLLSRLKEPDEDTITSKKPRPLAPSLDLDELITSFKLSDPEKKAIDTLVTCHNSDWDNFTCNYAFLNHSDMGSKELPPHLVDMCDPAVRGYDVSTEALQKAGWPDMLALLEKLAKAPEEIARLEKRRGELLASNPAQYHETITRNNQEQIDKVNEEMGLGAVRKFMLDHHMYDHSHTEADVMRTAEEQYDNFLNIATAAFPPKSNGRSALLSAMERKVAGEVLNPEEEAALSDNSRAVHDWEKLLQYTGESFGAPLNYLKGTLTHIIGEQNDFMEHLSHARIAAARGDSFQSKADLENAFKSNGNMLDYCRKAQQSLREVTEKLETVPISSSDISLNTALLDQPGQVLRTLANFRSDTGYNSYINKLKDILPKTSKANNEAQIVATMIDNLEGFKKMLDTKNNKLFAIADALQALKGQASPDDEDKMHFKSDDRAYLDACHSLRSALTWLNMMHVAAVNLQLVARDGGKPHSQPIQLFHYGENREFTLPSNPTSKLQAAYSATERGCGKLLSFLEEKQAELGHVLEIMSKPYDTLDITRDQHDRLSNTLNTLVAESSARQERWNELQRGGKSLA